MSDSATVSESIKSFSTMNLSVRCAFTTVSLFCLPSFHQVSTLETTNFSQQSTLSSLTRKRPLHFSLFFDVAHSMSSEIVDFHVWFSWMFSDAVEASTSGFLSLHRKTRFIIGFDFAVTLFFTWIFLRSFWHHFRTIDRIEMTNVKQIQKWFHSSRVEFPLVSVSASWFLVSMYLMDPNWFDRTTNQEQLCGFWKHVSLSGFFPLWSSWSLPRCLQTHTTKLPDEKNWRLREENQLCPDHHSMRLLSFLMCVRYCTIHVGSYTSLLRVWLFWYVFPWRTVTIRSHKSSAGIPSNLNFCIQGNDFWFCWIVRNWSLFLTHPTDLNKRMTSKNAQCSRSPAKSESWNNPSLHCFAVLPT